MCSRSWLAALLVVAVACATGTETAPRASPHPGATSGTDALQPSLGNGGYDVRAYFLDADVDPRTGTLDAAVTIEASADHALSAFNLDFSGPGVDQVTVDGEAAAHTRGGGELTVTPATAIGDGAPFTVTVIYAGRPDPFVAEGIGQPIGWAHTDDGVFIGGLPRSLSSAFPLNGWDKFTLEQRITVPVPFEAVGIGELADVVDRGAARTFVWVQEDPIADFLLAVGDYERFTSTTADGVAVHNAVPVELLAALKAPPTFGYLGDILDALTDRLGPYPFGDVGLVWASGYHGAAAQAGTRLAFFGSGGLSEPIGSVATIIAHELAHVWFGASLTPTLADNWLNEGFATFAELLWIESSEGPDRAAARVARMAEELGPTAPAIAEVTDLDAAFADAVYERGALALWALREELGDDTFFDALRAYVQRFQHQPVTTADFTATVEEVSGRDLDDFFQRWLRDERVPALGS